MISESWLVFLVWSWLKQKGLSRRSWLPVSKDLGVGDRLGKEVSLFLPELAVTASPAEPVRGWPGGTRGIPVPLPEEGL